MSAQKTLVTADELVRISAQGQRCELIEGAVVEMAPTGVNHGLVANRIAVALTNYAESRGLGAVLVGETGFLLRQDPDTVRAPDVAFVAKERLPMGPSGAGYFEGAPDIAVEVVSPSDYASQVQAKTQAWLDAGARLVWVVYPESRTVVTCRSQRAVTVLSGHDTLDAKPVFDDFAVPLEDVFR
ncbi:MAG: Uma2 family endonuclease [Chloroflexi bacterium]|nr:Uma2 family endonuclease [Chloroflexota bacterium]